ncbi:hypothetical protein ABID22_000117 [Pontibacter aydingkolensis]|uniref:AP2/ERF domain-containing protein n=1 Tax=Pontibacter aydingkolensis TaxID=1911536 RepID=A0ABS7CQY8_9BACT|nr:NUMOD4 domain-containing protein [Pontibacter aydingkolensis]MBW7466215.1 hypothetical protein [Pontibacter aydingkolensis]
MNNLENEIWRDIPGFNGRYQVSNLGRVKSLKKGKELIRKIYQNNVYLFKERSINYNVPRLVADAFIPNPNNLPDIIHISGDVKDNRAENLQRVLLPPVTTLPAHAIKNLLGPKWGTTSKYKGVTHYPQNNRWLTTISVYVPDGKKGYKQVNKNLGVYINEEDAAKAYDNALAELGFSPVNRVA